MNTAEPFYTKEEAADQLGITLRQLSTLVRVGNHEFTALGANAGPQVKGPTRWGFTPAQLDTLKRRQARRPNNPPSEKC